MRLLLFLETLAGVYLVILMTIAISIDPSGLADEINHYRIHIAVPVAYQGLTRGNHISIWGVLLFAFFLWWDVLILVQAAKSTILTEGLRIAAIVLVSCQSTLSAITLIAYAAKLE